MSDADRFCIAIDLGAGLGAKLGLFADAHREIATGLLRREEFEEDFDRFVTHLLRSLDELLAQHGRRRSDARAIGIASPGLFRSDGSYLLAAPAGPVTVAVKITDMLGEEILITRSV